MTPTSVSGGDVIKQLGLVVTSLEDESRDVNATYVTTMNVTEGNGSMPTEELNSPIVSCIFFHALLFSNNNIFSDVLSRT
jgi:hypothetical protein